ncbi:hypothetical protein MGN70_006618 [Eutypa lata]|nr:hypothetical protein MGN70_006618 [Eutypa lata]
MATDYPDPLIIPPLSQPHKQTFIILHGRGSSGEKFGPALLNTPISTSNSPPNTAPTTLASAFPHARFVFPSAARRRAAIYRRAYTHQWFDNWKLDPPATEREELQEPGLRETTAYLHELLHREIEQVSGGARNVVLGGLSQGQAAALTALLLWEGDGLAAAFGMCGWLPYTVRLTGQLELPENEAQLDDEDSFDPFQRDDESDEAKGQDSISDPASRAVSWLRDEIQVYRQENETRMNFQDTPLFLGHGTEDEKVNILLGRGASSCLRGLGMRVCWREYQGLQHWYSGDMLWDIVDFIRTEARWDI